MGRTSAGVAEVLGGRIRAGVHAPGARLPAQRTLCREFAVGPVTLQAAMTQLAADGLVQARGRHGTFVTADPGGRPRCALVFPEDPADRARADWVALQAAAGSWRDAAGWRCTPHAWTGADGELLRRRLAAGAYAGAVLVLAERAVRADPPAELRRGPLVVVAGMLAGVPPAGASLLVAQYEPAIEAACAAFSAGRRRRLAAIVCSLRSADTAQVLAGARRHGLEARAEWCLALPYASTARAVAHLLCTGRPGERPDCLLLLADGFAAEVRAGIADAGLRVPADMQLMVQVGDPAALLAAAVGEVRRLAAGGRPGLVSLPVAIAAAG